MNNIVEEEEEVELVVAQRKRRRRRNNSYNNENKVEFTNVVERIEVPPASSFFLPTTACSSNIRNLEEFHKVSSPTQEEYDQNSENYAFDLSLCLKNCGGNKKNDFDRYYDDIVDFDIE